MAEDLTSLWYDKGNSQPDRRERRAHYSERGGRPHIEMETRDAAFEEEPSDWEPLWNLHGETDLREFLAFARAVEAYLR